MKFWVGVPRNQPLAQPALVEAWIPADHLTRVGERLAAIRQSHADLKAQWAKDHPADPEPPDSTQIHCPDPESQIMVTQNPCVSQARGDRDNAAWLQGFESAGRLLTERLVSA